VSKVTSTSRCRHALELDSMLWRLRSQRVIIIIIIINKSRFKGPLKQFGLKMCAKSVQRRCRTCTVRNAIPCRRDSGSV